MNMKKKLFSFILFIFFSFNSAVFSIEHQTSSKLRSLIKNESLNINQLIEMSFNYRNEPYGPSWGKKEKPKKEVTNQEELKKEVTNQEELKKEATNQEELKKKYDRYALKKNYKNYWWVLIILGFGAFFLYIKTVLKPKKNYIGYFIIAAAIIIGSIVISNNSFSPRDDCYRKNYKVYIEKGYPEDSAASRAIRRCFK